MAVKKTMRTLLILMILICGSISCRRKREEKQEALPQGTLSLEYNCSYDELQNPFEATVKNISNHTQVLCQAFVSFPANRNSPGYNYSNDDEITFCNELGNSVCPNCTNDTTRDSYEKVFENITVSCWKEETTTTESTTAIPTTGTYESPEGVSTGTKTGGMGKEKIALIVCGGVVLAILICVALIIIKRTQQKRYGDDDVFQGQTQDESVRFEADTGALYISVDKGRNNSQIVENVLYCSTQGEQRNQKEELYTQVDKNWSPIGTAESNVSDDPGRSQELYTQVDKKRS